MRISSAAASISNLIGECLPSGIREFIGTGDSGAIIDYAERPSGVRGLIVGKFARGIPEHPRAMQVLLRAASGRPH